MPCTWSKVHGKYLNKFMRQRKSTWRMETLYTHRSSRSRVCVVLFFFCFAFIVGPIIHVECFIHSARNVLQKGSVNNTS